MSEHLSGELTAIGISFFHTAEYGLIYKCLFIKEILRILKGEHGKEILF